MLIPSSLHFNKMFLAIHILTYNETHVFKCITSPVQTLSSVQFGKISRQLGFAHKKSLKFPHCAKIRIPFIHCVQDD